MFKSRFPITDRIVALLRKGRRYEARDLCQKLTDQQLENAKQGQMINLTDLIAAAESICGVDSED